MIKDMDVPRKPNVILSELHELDGIIYEGQVLGHQFPEDNFLKISQNQAIRRKSTLQEELFTSQKYYGQQSFVLAFDKELSGIDAHLIPNLIKALTDIFDQTQKLLTKEKKNSVPLLFNGIVQSSFGFHFSIDKGQNLFGNDYENLLGIIFESLHDLNNSSTLGDIREVIARRFEGYKPVLKSYRSFFQSVDKAELPLKVLWQSPASNTLAFKMEPHKTEMLYQEFKKSLHTTEEVVEYRGEIQGLSQWDKKVEFLTSDDLKITAHYDENNADLIQQLQVFNKPRIGLFKMRESINDLTDEVKTEYFLIELKSV